MSHFSNQKASHLPNLHDESALSASNFSRGNNEKLSDKIFTLSIGNRVKRSESEISSVTHSGINRNNLLEKYEHLILLGRASPTHPACIRAVEGAPNPSVPEGYASWEAFIASEGNNPTVKNPKQELFNILRTQARIYALNQYPYIIFNNYHSRFTKKLHLSLSTEGAKLEFDKYKETLNNEYMRIVSERSIVVDAIIRKMSDEIRAVKHGTPNRWLGGGCWNSTTHMSQWEQSWKSHYLPKALQAIQNAPWGEDDVLTPARTLWLQKGITSLNNFLETKGWPSIVIPEAELSPPAVRAASQPASSPAAAGSAASL